MIMPDPQARRVGALFAGKLDDGGFMEYGHRGLMRAQREFGLSATITDRIPPDPEQLTDALRGLARSGAQLVIAHGGQNDGAASRVAAEFPDIRFVVTQGSVRGANLTSYEVRQEQSAFLAGVAAAHLTRSGVVGHISGIRVRPGLLGRAAYAASVAAANPQVRLLTLFCGTQDDTAVAEAVARAQIAAGADVIFTMLNAAIPGAINAFRTNGAGGARLIGNARDWTALHPDVFAASAMADVGLGVYAACKDWVAGTWPDLIQHFGVESPDAVRLQLAADLPPEVATQVALWRERLIAGDVQIAETYAGVEFQP